LTLRPRRLDFARFDFMARCCIGTLSQELFLYRT
jgi:hypothetical protein